MNLLLTGIFVWALLGVAGLTLPQNAFSPDYSTIAEETDKPTVEHTPQSRIATLEDEIANLKKKNAALDDKIFLLEIRVRELETTSRAVDRWLRRRR